MTSPSRHHATFHIVSLVGLGMCLVTSQGEASPPTDESVTTRTITRDEKITWDEQTTRALEHVDERLAMRATWIMHELWAQGWPAKVASAHRTLKAQRESFEAGHSKTLRSKHLCGKAVDFNLRPHHYPNADHPYWDAKDALAHTQKLLTLDAPSFRDRPHVELNEDCDWDSVKLGPAGIWRDADHTLTIRAQDKGGYTGHLKTTSHMYAIKRVRVVHKHSGERNKLEEATVHVTFEKGEGESFTRAYEVSTLTSTTHGYRRADWRWLRQADTSHRLKRASP